MNPLNLLQGTTKRTDTNTKTVNDIVDNTIDLFRALPFRSEEDIREEEEEATKERKKFACIPYIPEIAHPLKRVLKKAGVSTIFHLAKNYKTYCAAPIRLNLTL